MIFLQKIKDNENITIYEFNYLRLIISLIIYSMVLISAIVIFSKMDPIVKFGLIYLTAFAAIAVISFEISVYSKDLRKKISKGYKIEYGWKNRLCSKTKLTRIR